MFKFAISKNKEIINTQQGIFNVQVCNFKEQRKLDVFSSTLTINLNH